MPNKNFLRSGSTKQAVDELRLQPPPELPESLLRAFPDLREWNLRNQETHRRNHDTIRRVLSELIQATTEAPDAG